MILKRFDAESFDINRENHAKILRIVYIFSKPAIKQNKSQKIFQKTEHEITFPLEWQPCGRLYVYISDGCHARVKR